MIQNHSYSESKAATYERVLAETHAVDAAYRRGLAASIASVRVPYFHLLVQIRRELERSVPRFPSWQCQKASRVVEEVTGLEEVAGFFRRRDQQLEPHALNYDSRRGLYVCVSMDQFGPAFEPITILHEGTSVFTQRQYSTDRIRKISTDELGVKALIEKLKPVVC